jgi:23S rRNA (adenine2503-C2)-methyltransferase
MINLLDLTPDDLTAFFAAAARSRFARRQVSRWIHQRFVADIAAMTDLSRAAARAARRRSARSWVRPSSGTRPRRDGTRKVAVSMRAMRMRSSRSTFPKTTAARCASRRRRAARLDCAFCSTGKQGFNRNRHHREIVGQLWLANRMLLADGVTGPWIAAGRAPSPTS